jgi:hypothetical protein
MKHLFWKGTNLQFMEKKGLTSMIYKLQEMRLLSTRRLRLEDSIANLSRLPARDINLVAITSYC